ncbi:MAG: hypothetical protein AB1715_07340 [Acidobacteriota bacterium]
MSKDNKMRFAIAAVCCLFAAVPFLLVKFPPITDLPQHATQIRLFGEALTDPASPYKIQWITPYSLVYTVLGASWMVFGAEDAGRFGMLLVVLLSVAMLHLMAARLKRPAAAAVLASLLFFGHILYWGFYQFAFGWPIFLGFLFLLQSEIRGRLREALVFVAAWAVLYFAHILWFFVAFGWLSVRHLFLERDLKKLIVRGAGALPFIILGVLWYPTLAAYGFKSQTIWATVPFERLLPTWLADAAFGSVRGFFEPVFFGVIVAWILLAWFPNRRKIGDEGDKSLLLLFGLLFLLALVLPDKHTNTIRFCQRWVPPALAFLLLGLPPIRMRAKVLAFSAVACASIFFTLTSLYWVAFERREMSGLREALAALPEKPRVIGLSYIKESAIVRGRPFIQAFSYSQVYRGGELNFSFADFGPSLVVYRQRRMIPWTNGLEWFPEKAKKSDLQFFDFALISGDDKIHETVAKNADLQPLTLTGRWRSYKVNH